MHQLYLTSVTPNSLATDKPVALVFPFELEFGSVAFLWREEKRRTRRKTLGARTRTNNKLNPHMTQGPRIEPGTHWWEASAQTTSIILRKLVFLSKERFPRNKPHSRFMMTSEK